MKIVFVVISFIATLIACVLVFLRFGTLPLLPAAVGFLFAYLYFRFSKEKPRKKLAATLMVITILIALAVAFQKVFMKEQVARDASFEQKQEDSEKKALQELENLDEELNQTDTETLDSIP